MKTAAKQIVQALALMIALPAGCLCAFGRWRGPYLFFAQMMATVPGLPGSYLRVAFYRLTLDAVGPNCAIAFGSYFAHPESSLGAGVIIGAYCVLGQVDVGDRSLLSTHVQVLSGARQHTRDAEGLLTDEGRSFRRIRIGAHSWIGAGAIVMADLGEKSTVASGSVVLQDVPAGESVMGNPARRFFAPGAARAAATPPAGS